MFNLFLFLLVLIGAILIAMYVLNKLEISILIAGIALIVFSIVIKFGPRLFRAGGKVARKAGKSGRGSAKQFSKGNRNERMMNSLLDQIDISSLSDGETYEEDT